MRILAKARLQKVGSALQDWKLIVTGHSLGAGAAALLTLQLKDRYPGQHPEDRFPRTSESQTKPSPYRQ